MTTKFKLLSSGIDDYPSTATKSKFSHTCVTGSFYDQQPKTSNSLLMPSKKKKIKSKLKRKLEDAAALYTEDLGTQGIKRNSFVVDSTYHHGSISQKPLAIDEELRRQKRMQRFGVVQNDEPGGLTSGLSAPRVYDDMKKSKRSKSAQNENGLFVGTSTALEKDYLRLTDFPKAENVRPLPILIKSLAHIKSQYIKSEDFEWANEQLKSVRQDLTVQHIRNKFALGVYETHARLLLEHGYLNEFHQCQTMIQSLTSPVQKLDPSTESSDQMDENFLSTRIEVDEEECLQQSEDAADEFYAYGLLYSLVQGSWGEINRLLSTRQKKESDLTDKAPSDAASVTSSDNGEIPICFRGSSVRHALKVVKAVMHDDYQTFFRLYESAPHLSAYLMDFLVRRVRKNAYHRLVAAYRPLLSVEHFRAALAFEDLEETRRFLKENGALFIHELGAPPFWVDCKATFLASPRSFATEGMST